MSGSVPVRLVGSGEPFGAVDHIPGEREAALLGRGFVACGWATALSARPQLRRALELSPATALEAFLVPGADAGGDLEADGSTELAQLRERIRAHPLRGHDLVDAAVLLASTVLVLICFRESALLAAQRALESDEATPASVAPPPSLLPTASALGPVRSSPLSSAAVHAAPAHPSLSSAAALAQRLNPEDDDEGEEDDAYADGGVVSAAATAAAATATTAVVPPRFSAAALRARLEPFSVTLAAAALRAARGVAREELGQEAPRRRDKAHGRGPPHSSGPSHAPDAAAAADCGVFCTGVVPEMSRRSLEAAFSLYGPVAILKDNHKDRGFVHLSFTTSEACRVAVAAGGVSVARDGGLPPVRLRLEKSR